MASLAETVRDIERNPEKVRKQIESFERSAEFFFSERERLLDAYENQWVAIFDGKLVANAQSLKSGSGTSKPTIDRGDPFPSGPWHVAQALRYNASAVGCRASAGPAATNRIVVRTRHGPTHRTFTEAGLYQGFMRKG